MEKITLEVYKVLMQIVTQYLQDVSMSLNEISYQNDGSF